MKKNQLFERLWEHGRTLRRVGLVLVMCLTLCIPNAWADTELVNINLSSWSTQSVSAGGSVSGYYFKSASNITNGSGWVKSGNASKTQNYIGIPLSGINGSVTITVTHQSSRPTMGYELVTGNSAYNANYSHSNSMSTTRIGTNGTTTTITINNLSGSYGHLILGATGNATNGTFYISRIVVTTPAAASTKRIYMKAGAWNSDSPKFFVHSWGSSDSDLQLTALGGCESDVFYADIPSGNTSLIFTRQNPSTSSIIWEGSNLWNRTDNISISTYDLFTFATWNGGPSSRSTFTGGTYSPTTYTITYAANGGGGSMSATSGICPDADQAITSNAFTAPTGCASFAHWTANVAVKVGGSTIAAGNPIANGATIQDINSNITLTAVWKLTAPTIADNGDNTFSISGSIGGSSYYYTTNGSTPTTSSSLYSSAVDFSAGEADITAKAIAHKTGYVDSDPASQACVYHEPPVCAISECGNASLTYVIKVGSSGSQATDGSDFITSATPSNSTALGANTTVGLSTITITDGTLKAAAATNACFGSKPNMTGKIGVYNGASYSSSNYLQFTFTVKDGYTFTPCDIQFIVQPVSYEASFRWEVTDGTNVYGYGTGSAPVGSGNGATVLTGITSPSAMEAGTYYIRLYPFYNGSNTFRLGTDVILKGTTAAAACTAPTTVDISATVNEVSGYWFYPDDDVVLTATPTGSPAGSPVTYQWKKNGSNVGTNSATLTINDAAASDAGKYTCTISYGACSTTSAEFELKCMQFYLKNSGGSDISNHALTKVDATHATLSLSLTGGTTYKFRVTDGCNNWYGNSDATGMTSSNCTNWTMPHDADCKVTTSSKSATYTFNFDFSAGLLGSEMKVSVVYPAGDQAAGKVIYWDNNVLNWASAPWYRIGKGNHNTKTQMTLVPGTANLYKVTTAEYNGFEYWHIANNEGEGTGNIFWTKDSDPATNEAITVAMGFEGSPVTADAITVTPTAGSHGTGTSSDNDNCEFYEYGQQNGMKTDNVTISPYSNGTITVNYTNTSGSAATLTSGNADLAHSVILTSITAVADEGYDASAITINGGAYSANYVVTGNTTIAASFTLKTYTISYNKGTNGTGSKASETKTHGVNFTLPGSTFTYGGHAQDGWSTSDGGALAYALSGSYTTNAAQEFFPHWKCNTPTITDNGDNTVSITVPSGTTVRYTTDGTNPSSSTGTVYSTTFSIAADCTVKAIAYQSNCTDSEIASQACDYTAPANFQMIADASAGSEKTLSSGESITQGSKNCATLTGGTAVYTGPGMKVQKGSPYGWYFGSNSDVITITLTGHILQVGSIIAIDGNCGSSNNGIKINTNGIVKTGESSGGEFSGTYTVKAGDTDLIGTNVLTLTRSTGSATRMYSITLSNCQAATPCTTPTLPSLSNQAGCSYSAWNATPTNVSTITAAGESISYSWKKGATEKATTATYTPDADGTDYTVTVTVSKTGKIDAVVTSSALTATKYAATSISTQPTTAVDATVDVNYTLGSGMVATGEGDLSYQWYSYTSSGGAGEASIGSATSATYTTSKAVTGTYYYKVKVTADCGTVASNMITVTVSEPPCFSATNLVKNGDWSDVAVDGSIDAAKVVGTITGGTIKNTGSADLGSNNKSENAGLVMDGSSKQVTVTLSGSNHLTVGSVITLTAAVSDGAKSGTSKTSGLVVSGYDCSPVNKASETAYDSFTQSYTVTEESSLVEANSFTIALKSGLDKTYLHAITVTGCEDCTPIDPELSYSKTTIWMDDADLTATPSLDKGGSTGSATYVSNNTDVATVNESTGVVTAVARGTATIRATIAADATHCGKTATCDITIKEMDCEWTVIAGVTATSKNAGTPEGALIASSDGYKVNLQDWKSPDGGCGTGGKIGGDNQYIYLTLKSGEYFKDGDKVIVNIAKVPGVGDSKLHIYDGTTTLNDESTMIGTSGTPSCGENEIVLSGVPANTSSITLHRGNGPTSATLQNPYVTSMKVKRYVCPDSKEFLPTASSGNWNATANWIGSDGRGASLPTIDDRVVISKPVTIDIADAKAKDVLVNQYSGATGKITVSAGKALIIAEKMQKTTTGSNRIATAAADVIINSTRAAGTGALVMGSHDGSNAATVNFETKVRYDNGFVNQYLGSPFSDETPYVDYEIQLFKFVPAANGSHGWWNKLSYGNTMDPFMGYNQLSNNTSGNYLDLNGRTGHLNASTNVEFTIENGKMYYNSSWPENMFANSWTAPIHIDQFIDDDFTNVKQSIYIFNAGTPEQYAKGGSTMEGDAKNESAGTYTVIPVKSASELEDLGAVTTVIPAMQAFSVMATSSNPSLRLDFNRLVYTPALTDLKIEPTRAPRRAEAEKERPDAMRLRVRGENGWTANAYILGREDFTNGYDDGWDGEYMEGDGSAPQLYAATQEGYFVVNCVPEIEGTLMAFHPGSADNTYTLSFVYKGTETWYLNDLKEQQSTLISNETSYPFVSVAGDKAARFVISKTPINKIVTGIDETNGEKDAKVRKLLIDDHIYIIRGGKMYTADGALVK